MTTNHQSINAARSSGLAFSLSLALVAALSAGCPLQVPASSAGLNLAPAAQSGVAGSPIAITATATDATGAAISAAATTWSVTGAGCSVSPQFGAVVNVNASGAATCQVNATLVTAAGTFSAGVALSFTAPVVAASVTISGPDTVALGGGAQTFHASAVDSSGNAIAVTTGFSWGADTTLFTITGADQSTASVTAAGAGTGPLTVSFSLGGRTVQGTKSVHATATGLTITPSAQTAVVGTAITISAASTGTGGATGSGARTAWTATGNFCSVSSSVGAQVAVNASAAATCQVNAILDGLPTASTTLTFTAPIVPAQITIAGLDILDVHAAASTYTATVTDGKGNAIPTATVTWSSPSGAFLTITPSGQTTTVVANAVGTIVLQASTPGLAAKTKSITVNPALLAVTPLTSSIVQSPNKSSPLVGHATLQAKDAGGAVVPLLANLQFAAGLTEAHTPSDTSFNFLSTALNSDGTVALTFYDLSAPGTSHSITLTALGKTTAAFTVNVVVPDAVTLSLKPGDTVQMGASMTVTPAVTVSGASFDGAPVSLVVAGDAIFAAGSVPANATSTQSFSPAISHLGKATITPTSLGRAGTAVTIWGVPASISGTVGASGLSTSFPVALTQGQPQAAQIRLNTSTGALIDFAAEGAKGGTFAASIVPATGAPVSASCTAPTSTLACTLSATAAGNATLRVTWTSQDTAKTVSADFLFTGIAASPPVFNAGAATATWTGPLAYALSFPRAVPPGGGTVAYDLYASSAANADTDDNLLLAGSKTTGFTVNGTDPLTALFTAPTGTFSSRWVFGVKANTAGSSDSALKRLTLQTQAAAGLPSVPFLDGRTVFEVSVAGAVTPLFTVGPFASTQQLERTAPRYSPLDPSTRGLVGVLLNGTTQQLYARALSSTALAATPAGASVQTDAASCASSALVRPTLALDVLLNGAATNAFTVTPQFHSCDSAQLIGVTPTGAQELGGHYVDQVAQLGNSKLVLTDRGSLTLLDLTGATAVETSISGSKLASGALIAAVPVPGGSTSATVYTLDATNGLRSYDVSNTGALPVTATTVSDAATVFTGAFASAGTPVHLIAADAGHLVVECVSGANHTLWSLSTAAATPAPAKLVDASVILDQPTLGSSTAAGH